MPPPRELLDAMAQVNAMDQGEADALGAAIVEHFGPCLCQQYIKLGGHLVWVEMCSGHAFLSEQDLLVGRVQRLRFARARREHWRRAEWITTSALLSHDLGLDG